MRCNRDYRSMRRNAHCRRAWSQHPRTFQRESASAMATRQQSDTRWPVLQSWHVSAHQDDGYRHS